MAPPLKFQQDPGSVPPSLPDFDHAFEKPLCITPISKSLAHVESQIIRKNVNVQAYLNFPDILTSPDVYTGREYVFVGAIIPSLDYLCCL